ncbi:hypothetical protein ACFPFX_37700 [Streptomyces mauvecolor]|uniref:Uncharacterized protein n=1 Tax=Streptomyces mauvecolor TaxID=58345 RepID=A0ABV9UZM4_9ACTN
MGDLRTFDVRFVDRVLPYVGRAVRQCVLRPAVAAATGSTGRRAVRRAALRSTGSSILTCAAIRISAKALGTSGQLRQPQTGALSSGRTAGTAAFAAAAVLESPRWGAVLIPVALVAAVSRARSGTYPPGRVLADFTIGAGIAAVTCHWWPCAATSPPTPHGRTCPSPRCREAKVWSRSSTAMRDTADAVEAGTGGAVDLGRVTGDGPDTYFLNTFSIGVHPELVRARESREASIGKWPALAVGLSRVLADGTPIEVSVDGQPRRL